MINSRTETFLQILCDLRQKTTDDRFIIKTNKYIIRYCNHSLLIDRICASIFILEILLE